MVQNILLIHILSQAKDDIKSGSMFKPGLDIWNESKEPNWREDMLMNQNQKGNKKISFSHGRNSPYKTWKEQFMKFFIYMYFMLSSEKSVSKNKIYLI